MAQASGSGNPPFDPMEGIKYPAREGGWKHDDGWMGKTGSCYLGL